MVLAQSLVFAAEETPAAAATRRGVNLEWEPIEEATGYELELTSVATNKRASFKTREPKWNGNINSGRYKMRLRAFDDRGVPGAWSDPEQIFVKLHSPKLIRPAEKAELKTNEVEKETVKFSWEFIAGAKEYRIVINGGTSVSQNISGVETSIELPVAKTYTWTVVALMPDGSDGEVGPSQSFTLIGKKLNKPEIAEPETEFVQELSWSKPDRVESFDYVIARKEKGSWVNAKTQKGFASSRISVGLKISGWQLPPHSARKWQPQANVRYRATRVQSAKRRPGLPRRLKKHSLWNRLRNHRTGTSSRAIC